MRCGFLSDVHGDRKALERALEALADADRIVFLGDAIGGPRDEECVRLLRQRQFPAVCGNHDLDPYDLAPLTEEARQYLSGLPLTWEAGDLLALHSLHERRDTLTHFVYVRREAEAATLLARSPHRLVVVGHTHDAVLFTSRGGEVRRQALEDSATVALQPGHRYVVNVPDARTGVVVCTPDAVEFRLFHEKRRRDPRPVLGPDKKRRPW